MSLVRQKILQKILDVYNIPSLYSVHSCLAATLFFSLMKNALFEKRPPWNEKLHSQCIKIVKFMFGAQRCCSGFSTQSVVLHSRPL